jgi:hypothetical protein
VCVPHFAYLSTSGRLGGSYLLAIVNEATVSIVYKYQISIESLL